MPPVARWKAISGGNANDEGATLENTRDSPRQTRSNHVEKFMVHVRFQIRETVVKVLKDTRTNQVYFHFNLKHKAVKT